MSQSSETVLSNFVTLSRSILERANRGTPRTDFLREISQLLLDFIGCERLELYVRDDSIFYRWSAGVGPESPCRFDQLEADGRPRNKANAGRESTAIERLVQDVLGGRVSAKSSFITKHGSFWTGDIRRLPVGYIGAELNETVGSPAANSLSLIPFVVNHSTVGVLRLESARPDFFTRKTLDLLEAIAQTLGLAIANRRAQSALRERVKELTCLYGIDRILEQTGAATLDLLRQIAKLLPPAWQYPEIAVARIVLDGTEYATDGFSAPRVLQSEPIVVSDVPRGLVEVGYCVARTTFAEDPFLPEERSLIQAVAREISLFVERHEAAIQRSGMEEQLRHADRLATIGELAAGVAHEINEPLGAILGFAQLAGKSGEFSKESQGDLDKIVAASLQAREIVRKLMLFARQTPPQRRSISVNQVVEDALALVETRCAKRGVEVIRRLTPDLPLIPADSVQIQQVVVNLLINAVQAIQGRGTITVGTRSAAGAVLLTVEDTGCGMSEDVKNRIFDPFFTTKDVGEGIGLGLSLVHGIVTSHGGAIRVESEIARGTRFEIRLPQIDPYDDEGASACDYGE